MHTYSKGRHEAAPAPGAWALAQGCSRPGPRAVQAWSQARGRSPGVGARLQGPRLARVSALLATNVSEVQQIVKV